MPLQLPDVSYSERNVRDRILAKYDEYRNAYVSNNTPNITLQGERYEIAVAMHLYRQKKITHGNQISRWVTEGIRKDQSITLGTNTEYDFIIPNTQVFANFPGAMHVQGPLLGEAKSYTQALGSYIKKATGYCLNDTTLGGFCFVLPYAQATFFPIMVRNVYEILSDPSQTPGITGGWQWRNRVAQNGKPAGAAVVAHFAQYQAAAARQQRESRSPTTINAELASQAGFVIACYQVKNVTHQELQQMILHI